MDTIFTLSIGKDRPEQTEKTRAQLFKINDVFS